MAKKLNAQSAKNVSSFSDLRNRTKEMTLPEEFWGGIPRGTVGLVVGMAKSGKTIFCENLALSIAAGRKNFLGLPIKKSGQRVLFLSMEEEATIRMLQRGNKQIKGFKLEERRNINKNLFYSDETFLRSINDDKDWRVLKRTVSEHKADVVIIDSTNRINFDIETKLEANIVMQKFRDMAERYNCAILLIHHTNKSQIDKALTLEKLSGSSALSRDADFFVGVNKLSNGVRYVIFIENRYNPTSDKVIVFEIQGNTTVEFVSEEYESDLLKEIDKRYDKSSIDLVLNYFKENPNVVFETKQVIEQFNDLIQQRTIKDNLKKLLQNESITKVAHGKYKLTSK